MELRSLTPLAEYVDLIYTRCTTELGPMDVEWRIELRPPRNAVIADDGTGTVRIHGFYKHRVVVAGADMNAIQKGATVSIEVMTAVADYHIDRFKKLLTQREMG